MRITIDTTNKTIKVEDQVNIDALIKELKKLLGDDLKNYILLPVEQIYSPTPYYNPNPIWVTVWPYLPANPTYTPSFPTITCSGNT